MRRFNYIQQSFNLIKSFFFFSLGVSILELACNIEVPNGGEGWQQLRQGHLPSKFTNGKTIFSFKIIIYVLFFFCKWQIKYVCTAFSGLSVELQSVLRMMLTPEPSERPSVSELLALPFVKKHRWKRRVHLMVAEAVLTLVSLCQVMFQ